MLTRMDIKQDIEIIIENIRSDSQGNKDHWRVTARVDGHDIFLGFDTMPLGSPDQAFARAMYILFPKEKNKKDS